MRKLVTSVFVALALFGLATRASASCPPTSLTGPFCIDGDDPANHQPTSGVAGQVEVPDPGGTTKELGATNGQIYKVFNINLQNPPGVLSLTSIPDKVDLSFVSIQVARDTQAPFHQWLYFNFTRVTTQGSGFLAIELQKNKLNTTNCNYAAVTNFANSQDPGVQALIQNCNPWIGRSDNDIMLSWNQVGSNDRTIFIQHFCAVGSLRPECQGIKLPSWGAAVPATVSDAQFCPSGFCGEGAIDLDASIFSAASCQTFANTIPNTVTGNTLDFQATADFKDTVFFNFPPITNCGILQVTKRTIDADGKTFVDGSNPSFGYKVDRADGSDIRYDADQPNHTIDGPTPQKQIVRPNAFGGVAIKGGETQTHTDLLPGTNYRLIELALYQPSTYQLVNIRCFDGTDAAGATTTLSAAVTIGASQIVVASGTGIADGVSYIRIETETLLVTAGGGSAGQSILTVERAQLGTTAAAHASGKTVQVLSAHVVSTVLDTPSGVFQIVIPDGIKQTDCVITNQFVKKDVTIASQQRVRVNDLVKVTLGAALQGSETPGTVTIKLYSGSGCNTLLATLSDLSVTKNGSVYEVATSDVNFGTSLNETQAVGETLFSWTAKYAGDARNNASAEPPACVENTKVTITNTAP
jgi:hypothetical protein